MKKKVGLVLHPYAGEKPSGLDRSIFGYVKNIIENDKSENKYIVFLKHKTEKPPIFSSKNYKVEVINKKYFWLDRGLSKKDLDVCIFFTPVMPFFVNFKKSIILVHDLGYKHVSPKSLKGRFVNFLMHYIYKMSIRKADKIVAVSLETKKDILKFFSVTADKIEIIYNGCNKICSIIEKQVDVKEPFFFYVGVIKPRKNVFNLVKAFAEFKKQDNKNFKLVIAGKGGGEYYDEIINFIKINNLINDIKFLGFVTDEELSYLYKKAYTFISPSLAEGFGMTTLEAIDCGTPAVISDIDVFEEAFSNSVLYFDPQNINDIALKMKEISINESLRLELIEKGKKRAEDFSWEKSANSFIKLINDKKIAIFLSSFRAGGGERNMVNLANGFIDDGFNVDMLVIKPVGQYKDQVDKRINIVSLDAGKIIFSLPKLISYFKKEKPDIILATDEFSQILSIMARYFSKVNIKIAFRMGNMFSILFSRYKGIKQGIIIPFIAKKIYKYADIFIANSFGVADDVSKMFNVPIGKIRVINNPKDIEDMREKSKQKTNHPWLEKKSTQIILSSGRLREQKDLPTLLKAFAKVRNKIPVRLIFVGIGREQKRLEMLVDDLNLNEFVSFSGFTDNPYAFMSKSDVFVTTSLWEGFSNSLQEAIVCGMPVIATDCSSGPREMLAPNTDPLYRTKEGIEYAEYGVLVPAGDVEQVAIALEKLLTDSELRMKYKEKSLKRGNDFNFKEIFNKYKSAMGF